MARISIDNGRTFYRADELDELFWKINESGMSYGSTWDAIVNAMDDGIREKVRHEIIPEEWDEKTFLRMYLELADEDLIIG